MATTFDGPTKRIVLDSASVTASQLWSEWVNWLEADPYNQRWLPAFKQVGGDDLGGGLIIPTYQFLLNGWRVRPMEANHSLIITGNLFVDGGGVPVVQTLGNYNVSVQYTVPMQAQGIVTSGSVAPTAMQNAEAVWSHITAVDALDKLGLVTAILRNKTITDPDTGIMTVYADDGSTVLLTANLYENVARTQAYRGQGAEVRERLA